MTRLAWTFVALAALGGMTFAACKSGVGERCQSVDDCESGLKCNQAEHVCAASEGGDFDAEAPPDAPTDAPVDAPIDAPPDA